MGVAFSSMVVESRKGPRNTLVVTPTGAHQVGRDHLERLRDPEADGQIEASIVDHVEDAAQPFPMVIFRGRSDDGAGTWGISGELGMDEEKELARRLVRSHLPTHRRLLRAGTYVMVHTEFDSRTADLLRRASEQLHDELARTLADVAEPTPQQQADLWILRHYNFYFSLGFEKVVKDVLPERVPLIELRKSHIETLARSLGD